MSGPGPAGAPGPSGSSRYFLLCLDQTDLATWYCKLETGFRFKGSWSRQPPTAWPVTSGCPFHPREQEDLQEITQIPATDYPHALVAVGGILPVVLHVSKEEGKRGSTGKAAGLPTASCAANRGTSPIRPSLKNPGRTTSTSTPELSPTDALTFTAWSRKPGLIQEEEASPAGRVVTPPADAWMQHFSQYDGFGQGLGGRTFWPPKRSRGAPGSQALEAETMKRLPRARPHRRIDCRYCPSRGGCTGVHARRHRSASEGPSPARSGECQGRLSSYGVVAQEITPGFPRRTRHASRCERRRNHAGGDRAPAREVGAPEHPGESTGRGLKAMSTAFG